MKSIDSFRTYSKLTCNGKEYTYYSLPALEKHLGLSLSSLPISIRILLENLLRHEDGTIVNREQIELLANWNAQTASEQEIAFMPARVLLQDFTGVPCVVDLAVMRDAIVALGGNADKINPLQPVDLVIDHSVIVDEYGTPDAFSINSQKEYERNTERYSFLRWGQQAFKNFRVVPPDTGIVHQVNLEYLASVVFADNSFQLPLLYPDTVVGTDSHTTMINGLGVVGWGVGGIEAEAVMLGQPISMLIPQVVGFKLSGSLPAGATATDLVLTITQMLRKKGVVGKFVEFFGDGIRSLSLADRATIANMAPEYGATMGFFPIDEETLRYLRFTGRSAEQVALVESYYKAQRLFHTTSELEPKYSDTLELNLATVEPCIAGPKRPQDRIPLTKSKQAFRTSLIDFLNSKIKKIEPSEVSSWIHCVPDTPPPSLLKEVTVTDKRSQFNLSHGNVIIAAITSCTNTSNPSVLIAAGILAKKAVQFGLQTKPWVKTSLAPGSKAVTAYLRKAGLLESLEKLGFYLVGYGCTTCIGNSGPISEPITKAIQEHELVTAAVLSGNRNFEGRVNPNTRMNYLASPPLVVAYAIAGTMDIDFTSEPIGASSNGTPIYLKDILPSQEEIFETLEKYVKAEMFQKEYADVFTGDRQWQELPVPTGTQFMWNPNSTYIKPAPFFENFSRVPQPLHDITNARVLVMVGDSITTDHISPAGSFNENSPAGKYLLSLGVQKKDFNQYGARRGNHEIMMRGTFANIRLKNLLVPEVEGGYTIHPSSSKPISIYDAAMKYKEENIPLIVIAGKEYGSGSSRDWAAKGPALLGVKAIIAESFERIHRSNLIGMGILPLQFANGENAQLLGLNGKEIYTIEGVSQNLEPRKIILIKAQTNDGIIKTFSTICRIDTPNEVEYYRHGGILQYVLRTILQK
jgi:aconitate hydratase